MIVNDNSELESELYYTNDEHTQNMWDELVEKFKTNRFFMDKDLDIFAHFIDGIPIINIEEDEIFYRARKGNYSDKKDLNAPPVNLCNCGRLNPKGIQYLYVADSEDTSVSEVRPWIASEVTIAKFSPVKKLRIMDFTDSNGQNLGNSYRKIINENFSKPISLKNSDIDYLPTQAIAEYVKNKEYDGIKYSSSINKNGHNIVIFDANKMENIEITKIVVIKDIKYYF